MAPPGHKVVALDEDGAEKGEILSAAELVEVRRLLEIMRREKTPLDLEQLAQDQPHIHQIVDGKKASLWIWAQVGAIGKWVTIVIGAIVAWKTLMAGGQKP